MKFRLDPIFPENIADDTAVALSEFLYNLACECETHYIVQIRRYHTKQFTLFDEDQPWVAPPKKTTSRRSKKAKPS
jgi:hypothetical protein